MERIRQYFIRCEADGFINWSRSYPTFSTALDIAQGLDEWEKCGPHTVYIQDWVARDNS